jgi:uncharacterized membrane protein
MKKINITYWIFTGLFAAFMLMSGIQNAMNTPDSIALISTALGYPLYFVPFIGVVKILGVIGILIPGYPRVKEWAYAGLIFDLIAATFSMLAALPFDPSIIFMLLPFVLGAGSYITYHKKRKAIEALAVAR